MSKDKPTPQADVVWLALDWERLLAALEYPTRAYALRLLLALVQAFLRGQGARMGNYQGRQRHERVCASLCAAVAQVVVEDALHSSTWFPTLVQLGFTSMGAVNKIAGQDLIRRADGHS